MGIRVALHHKTVYNYDRPTPVVSYSLRVEPKAHVIDWHQDSQSNFLARVVATLGPHIVRLCPAPHSRTLVVRYSLRVKPNEHLINRQRHPQSNFPAHIAVPEPTQRFPLEGKY